MILFSYDISLTCVYVPGDKNKDVERGGVGQKKKKRCGKTVLKNLKRGLKKIRKL